MQECKLDYRRGIVGQRKGERWVGSCRGKEWVRGKDERAEKQNG